MKLYTIFRPVYVPLFRMGADLKKKRQRAVFEKVFRSQWKPESKNADKTFYIIFDASGNAGLFALVSSFIRQIKYAVDNGYVPVIDLQNFPNSFYSGDKLGMDNAWEHFFEQPAGYTLEEVYRSKNVILGSGEFPEGESYKYSPWQGNPETTALWKSLYRKYIRMQPDVYNYVEKSYQSLGIQGTKTLGVKCRGTDYNINTIPEGHYYQPSAGEVMDKIDHLDFPWDRIFIATEDENIFKAFEEHYDKDKLVYIDNKRISTAVGESWTDELEKRNINPFDSALKYLTEMYILSKCNSFIAGITCATLMMPYLSDGYEYSYVFDIGKKE